MKFTEMNLPDYILRALDDLGITEPTPVQARAIPLLFSGRDVIGKSRTGTGKTFAFGIPLSAEADPDEKGVQGLVVCPTRELAVQVAGELRKLNAFREGVKVVLLVGGSTMDRQIKALKGGGKIVVGTPGRLCDHIRRHTLKLADVKTVAIDEADEMMELGFKDELDTVLNKCGENRRTVMFSATMPEKVLAIAKKHMRAPVYLSLDGDENTAVKQFYLTVGLKDKDKALKALIDKLHPSPAIVFCNTKKMADAVHARLTAEGVSAVKIHGDMPQAERKRIMESVKGGAAELLIATDVAARGIDISDVEVVFNYDVPKQTEWYVHRIGRTGRAGKTGEAYTLVNTVYQANALKKIVKETGNVLKEYYSPYTKTVKPKTPAKTEKTGKTYAGQKGSSYKGRTASKKSGKAPYAKKPFSAKAGGGKKPYQTKREDLYKRPSDGKTAGGKGNSFARQGAKRSGKTAYGARKTAPNARKGKDGRGAKGAVRKGGYNR